MSDLCRDHVRAGHDDLLASWASYAEVDQTGSVVPVSLAHPEVGAARVSDRTFRILGALRDLGEGAHALRSIVDRAGLSRSTVQRHMLAGLRSGFIRQPRHGYYTLAHTEEEHRQRGAREDAPYSDPRLGPRTRALELLSRELGLTARLHAAVLTDVPVQMIVARAPVAASELGPPRAIDALTDAAGQVILAHLTLPGLDSAVKASILARGWAASALPAGLLMVAVPILRFGVPVGAISVTGPEAAVRSDIPACVAALHRAVRVLSAGTVATLGPAR